MSILETASSGERFVREGEEAAARSRTDRDPIHLPYPVNSFEGQQWLMGYENADGDWA